MWALVVCALAAMIALVQWRRSGLTWGHYVGLTLNVIYARVWHGLLWNGSSPLPEKGPAILVSNHTCSSDPAYLQAGCLRPLGFLIAREYYHLRWARWLFDYMGAVPVVRDGRSISAVRSGLKRLREGRLVCIFPEGGLGAAGQGRLRPGKGGAALLALRSRAPIFPAFIGRGHQHSDVPRAWLLPTRTTVNFGPEVDLSAYYDRPINRKLIEEVTTLLMQRIAVLDPKRKRNRIQELIPPLTIPKLEDTMTTAVELTRKQCLPCEGGVPPLPSEKVTGLLKELPSWKLADGQRIRREWRVKDFVTALDFFQQVGQLAEKEGHHPDLHLVGYRNVAIEIWTHAVNGLTENDFILAAKIDLIPVELKK